MVFINRVFIFNKFESSILCFEIYFVDIINFILASSKTRDIETIELLILENGQVLCL